MKTKLKTALLVLASATLLASCGVANPADSATSSHNGGETSSSTPKVTQYAIVDRTSGGIHISLSKTQAAKGETITITISLEDNYVLTGIYANKVECTKVNDTTYTFVMGDSAVAITATLSVTGEVVTSGDIAVALAKQEDGTYKGSFSADSSKTFLLVAGGKEYGYVSVDFDRSYADINSPYVSGNKGVSQITVGANAIYEITFDLTKAKPIVIYRTGILEAPKTESAVNSYFCGFYAGHNVLDTGAFNVRNLNHVSYRNSRSKVSYTWDLYKDGSLATATDLLTEKTSKVYKSIKDGVYTVVDEYIETGKDSDGNYYDRTKTQDTTKFAAKYSIVDEVDNAHYERTDYQAYQDVITPSHELHSINSEIQYGYYIGYTIEDELKACDRTFTGLANSDGSFTTTIYAWKNYSDDESVRTRYQYETTININADGTLSSVTYLETYYTESNWSFNDSDPNGGSARTGTEGTIKQSSSVSYGYGAASEQETNFDTTPYFISSISNLTVKSNADKTKEAGHVKYKEVLDESRREPYLEDSSVDNITGYTTSLSYDFAPSTALDSWQYGIISSDDASIVGRSPTHPFEWIASGSGTTQITIGNHTTNLVTAKTSVTVDDAPVPTHYYVWAYGNESDEDVPTSSSVVIKAGKRMKVYLWASPSEVVAKPIVSCSNPNVILSLSDTTVTPTGKGSTISTYPAYILTIDASNVTTDTSLSETITVTDERSSSLSETIRLTIKAGVSSLLPSSIEGTTWTAHNYANDGIENFASDPRYMEGDFVAASMSFTSEEGKEISGTMYKKGVLSIGEGQAGAGDYDFYYDYGINDAGSIYLNISYGGSSLIDGTYYSFAMGGSALEEYGCLGVYMAASTWSGQDDSSTNYIIGYPEEDDYAVEYEWFTIDA